MIRHRAKNRPENLTPQVVWPQALTRVDEAQPVVDKAFTETPKKRRFSSRLSGR
jgi:hypothetical protein